MDIHVDSRITISESELEERFVRSSGPGGQNVNKVASAVQLRFHVARSSLPEAVRERLREQAKRWLTDDGATLVIDARRFRTQEQNRRDARERLAEAVRKAARAPKPRKPTRVSRTAKKRRLDAKRRRGKVKSTRGRVDDE